MNDDIRYALAEQRAHIIRALEMARLMYGDAHDAIKQTYDHAIRIVREVS